MKAAPMKHRPAYPLAKQTDIQSFYHLQMPRWLFSHYPHLSLETKVAYTFLLNRFQMSKMNGWINEYGEVFIVYTRESLAKETQIHYRKIIEAMKELARENLIYEKRCGRGQANQIYLAKVDLDAETYCKVDAYESFPFVSRPAETACLADTKQAECGDSFTSRPSKIAYQEAVSEAVTCENDTSSSADFTCLDLPNRYSSNIKKSDINRKSVSQSVCYAEKEEDSDEQELERILENCGLEYFSVEEASVLENAVERIYYSERMKIGSSIIPKQRIRKKLGGLRYEHLRLTVEKIRDNTSYEIKNSTAYVMATLWNCITETDSDLMTDPFLNRIRKMPCPAGGKGG